MFLPYGTAILLLFVSYTIHALYSLYKNARRSWSSGLPTVVLPFHPMDLTVMLTAGIYKPIISRLPFGLPEWRYLHFFYKGWPILTQYEQFEAYGDVCIHASPGGRVLYIGDADVANQVLARRQDFPKDVSIYKFCRLYGDSVLTTEGNTWRVHRKVTSPPFSESVHSTVWSEALAQITALVGLWTSGSAGDGKTASGIRIFADTKSFARNVISKAGFGVTLPVVSGNGLSAPMAEEATHDAFSSSKPSSGFSLPYGEALDWVLDNIILAALRTGLLKRGPSKFKKTGFAYEDVGNYLQELVKREQNSLASGNRNLLAALVRDKDEHTKLSGEDVIGNLFIFAVAGLETTAGTLQYAILHLALCHEQQEWFLGELDRALKGESDDPLKWDYPAVFEKLACCLCVISETLRLFPTFMCLAKGTGDSPQPITYKDTDYTIPERTTVFICLTALHHNPLYWGASANKFQPANWDARNPSSGWHRADRDSTPISTETRAGKEPFCNLRLPVKGAYLPFSEGFRSCLGKNFALVEMCAFLAVAFRRHGVVVARREGESQEMADVRAWVAIREHTQQGLTLMMAKEVEIELVAR